MPELRSYDYALVRVVPRVERGEFLNAGVLLSCEADELLTAYIELDVPRLLALWPGVDVTLAERHLAAIPKLCEGGPCAGPLGKLPRRARFHWMTATRSALVQTSPVHSGRTRDPHATLRRLMDELVRRG